MHYELVIFGVKDSSADMIGFVHEQLTPVSLVVTISSAVEKRNQIAGFMGLSGLCNKMDIPLYEADSYKLDDEKTKRFFSDNSFDLGIVMGWQRLIPLPVLNAFQAGVFGFHGNAGYLPFGRGRSPLNWSMLLGDTRFNLNLFCYDEKADSPNVFATKMFSITPHDTIRTASYKNQICSKTLVRELVGTWKQLRETDLIGRIPVRTDSKDFDSWYDKRTPADGRIDWTGRTREIYNLIRAVSEPFSCAFCELHTGTEIKSIIIKEAHPFDEMMDFHDYAPGEIIEVFDNRLIVRTVDGSLIIDRYDCDTIPAAGMILR